MRVSHVAALLQLRFGVSSGERRSVTPPRRVENSRSMETTPAPADR